MDLNEIKALANNQKSEIRIRYYQLLGEVAKFVTSTPNKERIANSIIEKVKGLKPNQVVHNTLLKLFIDETLYIIEGTQMFTDLYMKQAFLKQVYENASFQYLLVTMIRQGYKLFTIKNEEPEIDWSSLSKEEKGKLKAQKMREAKARKREERLKAKEAEEAARLAREKASMRNMVQPKVQQPTQQASQQSKSSVAPNPSPNVEDIEMTPEMEAYIEQIKRY